MIRSALLAFIVCVPCVAHAEGCDDYPFGQGINIEDVDGGIKIVATAAVSVSFDDIDAIKDARDEATLEAKSLIAQFMSEGVRSEQEITKAVEETKSMQGDNKINTRNELVTRVKTLTGRSQALLRGVVPLGECYTKGKEFRASVGIRPKTIASAGELSDTMSNSLANEQPSNGASAPAPGSTGKPSGVESYSDTEDVEKF
jgi:hypothetical protein